MTIEFNKAQTDYTTAIRKGRWLPYEVPPLLDPPRSYDWLFYTGVSYGPVQTAPALVSLNKNFPAQHYARLCHERQRT